MLVRQIEVLLWKPVVYLASACLLSALALNSIAFARTTDGANSAKNSVATSTNSLHLQNNSWSVVRVEVRVGESVRCDSLGSLGIQTLQQGQEWQVNVGDPVICWRREQKPGNASSGWTSWSLVQLGTGENRVLSL